MSFERHFQRDSVILENYVNAGDAKWSKMPCRATYVEIMLIV